MHLNFFLSITFCIILSVHSSRSIIFNKIVERYGHLNQGSARGNFPTTEEITTILPPDNWEDATHLNASLGGAAVINCSLDQNSPVEWQKRVNNTYVPVRASHDEEDEKDIDISSLILKQVSWKDDGWYKCKEMSFSRSARLITDSQLFYLHVLTPPIFTKTPNVIMTANIGDDVVLNCVAKGKPEPEIFWMKNRKLIKSSTNRLPHNDTQLRISVVNLENFGDYTCIAKNSENTMYHTTHLIPNTEEEIIVWPFNSTKFEGGKIQMDCNVKNSKHFKWLKMDSTIPELLGNHTAVYKNGSLIINNLTIDDSSQYKCKIEDKFGNIKSDFVNLNVQGNNTRQALDGLNRCFDYTKFGQCVTSFD